MFYGVGTMHLGLDRPEMLGCFGAKTCVALLDAHVTPAETANRYMAVARELEADQAAELGVRASPGAVRASGAHAGSGVDVGEARRADRDAGVRVTSVLGREDEGIREVERAARGVAREVKRGDRVHDAQGQPVVAGRILGGVGVYVSTRFHECEAHRDLARESWLGAEGCLVAALYFPELAPDPVDDDRGIVRPGGGAIVDRGLDLATATTQLGLGILPPGTPGKLDQVAGTRP